MDLRSKLYHVFIVVICNTDHLAISFSEICEGIFVFAELCNRPLAPLPNGFKRRVIAVLLCLVETNVSLYFISAGVGYCIPDS